MLEEDHETAHVWVGGQMGDSKISVDDPVFWLHHCFVDCLWASWQDQHRNIPHYRPIGAPVNEGAPDSSADEDDAQMYPWNAQTTPKSVLPFRTLAEQGGQKTVGYTYEQNGSHGTACCIGETCVLLTEEDCMSAGGIF